jgi:SAM-dependent methyltransferase
MHCYIFLRNILKTKRRNTVVYLKIKKIILCGIFVTLAHHCLSYTYQTTGFCESCQNNTTFIAHNEWFRDHYNCSLCTSIPRERILMHILNKHYPSYKDLVIHESSPVFRSTSLYLKNFCKKYSYSYYDEQFNSGAYLEQYGCYNQNLAQTSFEDNTFDIIITQDVMEHVFEIEKVFKEIARILKINGSHIFTTPLVNKNKPTVIRASLENGNINYIHPKVYHGNPIDNQGSLVTYDFGYDIARFIPDNCHLSIYSLENSYLGLEKTEYNEVCVLTKMR